MAHTGGFHACAFYWHRPLTPPSAPGSNGDQSVCMYCPPGREASVDASACEQCAMGRISSLTTGCTDCADVGQVTNLDQSDCHYCPPGTEQTNGSAGANARLHCLSLSGTPLSAEMLMYLVVQFALAVALDSTRTSGVGAIHVSELNLIAPRECAGASLTAPFTPEFKANLARCPLPTRMPARTARRAPSRMLI